MEAKEKAKDLLFIYWNTKVETPHVRESIISKELAVKCALIAINEILINDEGKSGCKIFRYWQEVKKEIQKL